MTNARRTRQRGQVLVWFLATMVAAAAVLYGVYNVGQLHVAKQRTVNAADAGAHAAALVQARGLNFIAYSNRAIVANEVFAVQVLSMNAWLRYLKVTSDNLGTYTRYIPYVGPYISAVLKTIAKVADGVAGGTSKALDVIVVVLEAAKTAAQASGAAISTLGGVMAQDAATKTVEANRTTFGGRDDAGVQVAKDKAIAAMTFVANNAAWIDFTEQYSGNKRSHAKDVLLRSRDMFSTDRPGQSWFNVNLWVLGLEKQGGTKLKGYDRWESQDTLEFWTWSPKGRKYVPVGWGRATLAENETSGDVWSPRRSAQTYAYYDSDSHGGWSGVPAVYDIKDRSEKNRATLGVDFYLVTTRARTATPTTEQLGIAPAALASPLGSPQMNERLAGDQLAAIARARAFFERPQRGSADFTATALFRKDDAKEYASLYNPYWQARLAPLHEDEKKAVAIKAAVAAAVAGKSAAGAAAFTP